VVKSLYDDMVCFFAHNGLMNKYFSQKHGINGVKIGRCSNGIWVETTFDNNAIYERNMRDCTLCHRHLIYSIEYLDIDGMQMLVHAYYSCPSAITLFLLVALGGKWRFLIWPLVVQRWQNYVWLCTACVRGIFTKMTGWCRHECWKSVHANRDHFVRYRLCDSEL